MRASQRSLRLAMINRATERRGCRRREGTGHRRGDGERTVLTHVTNARSASSCAGVPAMAAVDPRRLRGKLCVIPNCLPQADKRCSPARGSLGARPVRVLRFVPSAALRQRHTERSPWRRRPASEVCTIDRVAPISSLAHRARRRRLASTTMASLLVRWHPLPPP